MNVPILRANHVFFVRYGYVKYYNYWAMTNQAEDPPGFREYLMSEAVTMQFPKNGEEIEWWRTIVEVLKSWGLVDNQNPPCFGQIRADVARDIISALTESPISNG